MAYAKNGPSATPASSAATTLPRAPSRVDSGNPCSHARSGSGVPRSIARAWRGTIGSNRTRGDDRVGPHGLTTTDIPPILACPAWSETQREKSDRVSGAIRSGRLCSIKREPWLAAARSGRQYRTVKRRGRYSAHRWKPPRSDPAARRVPRRWRLMHPDQSVLTFGQSSSTGHHEAIEVRLALDGQAPYAARSLLADRFGEH